MIFSFRNSFWVLAALIFFTGCTRSESSIKNTDPEFWAKRAWLEKASRALRFGDGVSPSEDVDSLMSKSKEQIIDIFMQDKRFMDTVVDFNLFFLGLKDKSFFYTMPDGARTYIGVDLSPHAFTAARAVWEGKDYFSLFDLNQPLYLQSGMNSINAGENTTNKPEREFRIDALNQSLLETDSLLDFIKATKDKQGADIKAFCEEAGKKQQLVSDGIEKAGIPYQIRDEIFKFGGISRELVFGCFLDPLSLQFDTILTETLVSKASLLKLKDILDFPGVVSPPKVQSPLDIVALKDGDFGIQRSEVFFSDQTWNVLPNSSTNYNRKRAAYILKNYFCDDLTPINIALPSMHAGNKHASDPSCASCHYKMDPMAGFFRNIGVLGNDFENTKALVFDDGAIVKNEAFSNYLSAWLAPAEAGRKWNVGYIRSATDSSRNTYGESLQDLVSIIKNSSEVKQCITKRMTEYYLGKDQVYDTEWVNSLAQRFEQAKDNPNTGDSSQAFKDITKGLLLSNTFVKADPEKNQCYDFAPGHENSTLPCEISYLIKKNCVQCHSSNGAAGGLDLSSWKTQGNGETNFNHLHKAGLQQSKKITFERLLEGLSTADEAKLMPLNKFMSPTERAQIYKWVSREASSVSGGRP
ncbi:MAG: hypothetical protein WCI18_06420 [Pseudomonadota bacterium]